MKFPEMTIWYIVGASLSVFLMTLGTLYASWRFERDHVGLHIEYKTAFRFAFSKMGLFGAASIPLICAGCFHGFVAVIWLTLHRWPAFGEQLNIPWLQTFFDIGFVGFIGMTFAQIGIGIAFLASIAFARFRWMSFCCITEFVFSLAVFFSIHLAPHEFLNWLFD